MHGVYAWMPATGSLHAYATGSTCAEKALEEQAEEAPTSNQTLWGFTLAPLATVPGRATLESRPASRLQTALVSKTEQNERLNRLMACLA
jgi:hypothetical protein